MVGFDQDRGFAGLNGPVGYHVEAAFAVGRLGDPTSLPQALRDREQPNSRTPLAEIVFEGSFKA